MDATRLEVKRVADEVNLPEIRSWLRLHPMGFSEAYPPRWINNIYFDTPELLSYAQNVAGISTRRKVRLRWYGEGTSAICPVFEIKYKRNKCGWKVTHPLSRDFDLRSTRWSDLVYAVRKELPERLRPPLDDRSAPVIINRYFRHYYESFGGSLRVTLDTDLVFYGQTQAAAPNLRYPLPRFGELVVEFKLDAMSGIDLMDAIAEFPVRVSRCSKYVLGVERIFGY